MSETYQALYRKWRPMTFDDVVGQKHVSDTLKNSVASGRITHAYLFCGTRGTGKTSTAKIFSRAVNCENPIDGEPCNECSTCRGILDGSIMDVYEMDAASNRGVDNIREIRDEVMYIPAGCTYKVYIIDEVHMLTTEAFNAILKTLEEPPAHALFILATTEPHKIPATVLSRCQRFDFRRIGVDDIAGRLNKICESEEINATPDAIEMVAELGDGSMRDALSILDQCAAFGLEKLSTTNVAEIVGVADPKFLFDTAKAVADGDIKSAFSYATECFSKGKEVQNFLEELTQHLRSLLICKATDNPMELLERTAETTAKYQAQAEFFSIEQLMYSIRVLGEAISQAKWMSTPQVAAEVCLIKLCNPSYSTEPDAMLTRIEKLERKISSGSFVQAADEIKEIKKEISKPEEGEDAPPWDVSKEEPKPENQEDIKEEKTETVSVNAGEWEFWADALQEIKKESKALFAFLYNAKAYQKGNEVQLELGNKVAYDRIAKPEGIDYLAKLFSRVAGEQISVSAYMEGQIKKEEKKQTSIFDLAEKKDAFGDVITIVNNSD
ncbi:MAG: DNA polymerase III subunit gamma/tau [Clostridia bacterium]|nr:DNA polymerase III subunit gamma/tau [Clostridia bacterium]